MLIEFSCRTFVEDTFGTIDLSNPKPRHTTVRLGRGARQCDRAVEALLMQGMSGNKRFIYKNASVSHFWLLTYVPFLLVAVNSSHARHVENTRICTKNSLSRRDPDLYASGFVFVNLLRMVVVPGSFACGHCCFFCVFRPGDTASWSRWPTSTRLRA